MCAGLYICPECGGLIWSLATYSKDRGDPLNLAGRRWRRDAARRISHLVTSLEGPPKSALSEARTPGGFSSYLSHDAEKSLAQN